MIFSILDSIKLSLLRNITIKFFHEPEFRHKENDVKSASLLINIGITTVAVLILVPFAGMFADNLQSPGFEKILYTAIPVFLLQIGLNQAEIYFQYKYQFDRLLYGSLIRQISFFLLVILLVTVFKDYLSIISLIIVQGISFLLNLLYYLNYDRKLFYLKGNKNGFLIAKMMSFGKYILGTNLAAQISRNLDHMLTASLVPGAEGRLYVAFYNSINRISNFTDLPSLAVADVLYPRNTENFSQEGISGVRNNLEKMLGAILSILIPCSLFIFFFPKPVIYIIAGEAYYEAIPLLQLTIFFLMSRPLSYQLGSTLIAIGKQKLNFYIDLLMLAVNLVSMVFFLKTYGGYGAAYALMVSGSFSIIIMFWVFKATIGLKLKNVLLEIPRTYKRILKLVFKIK